MGTRDMKELKIQILKQKLHTGQEWRETQCRKKRAIVLNVGREDIQDIIPCLKKRREFCIFLTLVESKRYLWMCLWSWPTITGLMWRLESLYLFAFLPFHVCSITLGYFHFGNVPRFLLNYNLFFFKSLMFCETTR